ncbi:MULTISPECIES: globin domain-containing protein [unclassified Streptomyces]|uniref:globin domain-containing protein n=1 Tax=unclassified Streptomyces TaxID=2593676 RepID=UPI0016615B5B|nr:MULTISPECIES: globin domain-containing protein [unclassified Streptomyces]MBD0710430.1 flavohemoprotein [Streptomyces sp. CBMA291]MBD0712765.1 flavohemoprotein [Streptomyces sp. CBMA370]
MSRQPSPHTPSGDTYDEYHALLARQDAMRLRQRLLAPARPAPPVAEPGPAAGPRWTGTFYDGAADQRTIHRHLPLVTPFSTLIGHLYEAMFDQHPYLRGLFPESMDFQRAHLERAFWYLIEHLDRPDEVTAFCARMGRDHRKLGVRPVHFQVFEAALAQGLRRSAGERWTQEMEDAWLRMLRLAVAAMVDGAEEAVGEPAYWNATVTGHQLRGPGVAVLRVRTAEPFPHRAGQYTRVESPLLPHTWRPYSLARAPRQDGELEFHVRRTGPGGVSEALVSGTRVGDTLRLGPAQGTMTLDPDLSKDVLIVAGDTGWATAKALLEELSERRPAGLTAHVYLGARTPDDLYDTPALADLERGRPWLRVVPVIGEGPGAGEDRSVMEALGRRGDWSGHLAYVSGPSAMVTATVHRLTSLNLPADHIRHDPVNGTVPLALTR